MDNHIPTTATAVQKLNRLAKARRKTSRESLAAAQDAVAREHGYHSWKHVKVCLEATTEAKQQVPVLHEAISAFLAAEQASSPASEETLKAKASGLLFAMDVKDADSVVPENTPGVVECADAASMLVGDIWLGVLRREKEQEEFADDSDLDDEEQVRNFLDYVANFRFFRYEGPNMPASLDDAWTQIFREFFFPPSHVWIAGKLFDMADVRQVRVDGRTVFSTSPGAAGRPPAAAYAASPPRKPGESSAVTAVKEEGAPVVARLDVRKLQPTLYELQVSYSGQELFAEGGFTSIADALRSAAEVTGAIGGFEVSYGGLIAGTYGVAELAQTADAVAQRAVDLAAAFGRR